MRKPAVIALSALLAGCATQQEISAPQSPPSPKPYSYQEGGILAFLANMEKYATTEQRIELKKEQCIELMVNDKSWRDTYVFLNAAIGAAPEGRIYMEPSVEQRTQIQLFKGLSRLSPEDQAVFKKTLYRVIPEAQRGEKLSPLDIIFISEMDYRIRDYINHGTQPTPSHWLRNIHIHHEASPSPTNSPPTKRLQQPHEQ